MYDIYATYRFNTLEWAVSATGSPEGHLRIYFSLDDENIDIHLSDIKFGYEIEENNSIVQYGIYPSRGKRFIKTDQNYLVINTFRLKYDTEYKLYIWLNDGKESRINDHTFNFVTNKIEKPYKSWIWDGYQWKAPIESPSDFTKDYIWNEQSQIWETVNE